MKLISYQPAFTNRWNKWSEDVTTSPSVNILEKDNGFYLDLVSPGLAKDDFKIELKDNQLIISAEKKNESEQKENGKFWRKEYSFNSFKRSFYLPDSVAADAIEASYDQGVLKLFIPKKAEVTPPVKTIEIV